MQCRHSPSHVVHGPMGVADLAIIMVAPCLSANIAGHDRFYSVGARGGCGGGKRGDSMGGGSRG